MKKLLYKLIAIGLLTSSFFLGAYWYQYKVYLQQPVDIGAQPLVYEVKPGDNLTRIMYRLHRQGVVKKPRFLLWYAKWHHDADAVHVGEYEFQPGITGKELVNLLVSGKVKQYAFTIIEGWTFRELVAKLHGHAHIRHLLTKKMNNQDIMRALNLAGMHPEGRFMPDTYHHTRNATDIDLLRRAYHAMQSYLATAWQKRAGGLPIETPYEALILASIIEKETGKKSERRAIAGVFVRRLEKNMRLQTDPTVIYGMGLRYKGNIRRKDLKQDTPYNTYTRSGLPPTPIAMPSREAIDAALHPDEAPYLYFVAKGDGSHHFSATLDEHNRAVIKYQLKGRKSSFSSYKKKNR